MREFHTDFIQCACVTTVSDATAIVVATSHELYSLTGRAFQEEFHSPHSIATPILSLTPIRHQSAVLLRTAESLQVVSFVEKRLVFCQSLPVRALACCAVRDTVYVVTEEGRRLAVRVFNLHTSRSSFTPQQTLLLSEGTVVGSACQVMPSEVSHCQVMSSEVSHCQVMSSEVSHYQVMSSEVSHYQVMSSEVSHCQVMPSETTNCQICADSSFVVVTYGNICHLLANNQGTLETVAQTRALSEPILSVCFAADSFFLVTPHAITSITPHLNLLHPLRSVLTGITPVTRPSLRLLQQILATPRPMVSAASLLTLLLLQQLQRLESVLQTVATAMAAEAEKVKEAWKWQLEEEKKKGSVSFSHACFPFTPQPISCSQLDALLSFFDLVSIEEFSPEEEKAFRKVVRIYRRLKPFRDDGYVDTHGIRFLLAVLLLTEDLLPTSSIPYSAVLEGCLSESKDAIVKEACVFLLKKELHVEDQRPSQPVAVVASPPPVEGKYSALFTFSSNRYRDFKCTAAPVAEAFDPEEWENRVTWKHLKACHFVLWEHNHSTCSHMALKCAMVGSGGRLRRRTASSSPAARSRRRSSCWR